MYGLQRCDNTPVICQHKHMQEDEQNNGQDMSSCMCWIWTLRGPDGQWVGYAGETVSQPVPIARKHAETIAFS